MYRPNLRQLEFLVALNAEEHFGRAAERCHVTQSTLSAGIKELEEGLGIAVAERTRRNVKLTPLGRDLAGRARQILADVRAFSDHASAQSGVLSGDFRIGAIPTLGPFLLPQVLPCIRRQYPQLRLYMREAVTDDLLEDLQAGKLDAVLIALPYEVGDLAVFPMFEDNYHLAVPTGHALSHCMVAGEDDVAGLGMMLLEKGHCLQRHALSSYQPKGPLQDKTFEATSLPTLVAMVAEGLGTTLLPDIAVQAGVTRGHEVDLVPLKGALPRTVALTCRKHSPRREEIRQLAELIAKAHSGAVSSE
ncbi:hydrogen peroxide-inducible genes activator [Roseibium aggregatum]|uniref:LysR family transcriptional regulator n=1 Tax=Roseibium aggregatum TaxID=187304 RepID=A0A939EI02_9HYPH|nr:hydrogen peroxide-inducible genes activator [Roseibium aggregatum]MBN9673561.1 LysR family transcriptional regulator [Roseibium aggregatum]